MGLAASVNLESSTIAVGKARRTTTTVVNGETTAGLDAPVDICTRLGGRLDSLPLLVYKSAVMYAFAYLKSLDTSRGRGLRAGKGQNETVLEGEFE